MSKFKIKNQRGISLIEAIVCICLIAIVVFSIIKLFPIALKLGSDASKVTIATNLAQAKIEECFFNDYNNLAIGQIEAKHRLASSSTNPFYFYQRQTTVEYVDSNLNSTNTETGIKKVSTTVFWLSPILKSEKKVELKILITKKD